MKLAILLLKKYIVWKEEILSIFMSKIHLLLQVQETVIRWITSPYFMESGAYNLITATTVIFSCQNCFGLVLSAVGREMVHQSVDVIQRFLWTTGGQSMPCELRTTYLFYGRHPWTNKELAIFQTPSNFIRVFDTIQLNISYPNHLKYFKRIYLHLAMNNK